MNVSINIIVAIAGICLIDLCYIFVIHTKQDATQRNKTYHLYSLLIQSVHCPTKTTTDCGPDDRHIAVRSGIVELYFVEPWSGATNRLTNGYTGLFNRE
jgi:hypothetical protein